MGTQASRLRRELCHALNYIFERLCDSVIFHMYRSGCFMTGVDAGETPALPWQGTPC